MSREHVKEVDPEDSPFADWYREGSEIPVCHPLPHCSAYINFPAPDEMVWVVENHKTGERKIEHFDGGGDVETEPIEYENE